MFFPPDNRWVLVTGVGRCNQKPDTSVWDGSPPLSQFGQILFQIILSSQKNKQRWYCRKSDQRGSWPQLSLFWFADKLLHLVPQGFPLVGGAKRGNLDCLFVLWLFLKYTPIQWALHVKPFIRTGVVSFVLALIGVYYIPATFSSDLYFLLGR